MEERHFVVSADSGSGKTQLTRQILYYVRACGDVAVVHDPNDEFVKEFADPKRDTILHPYYRDYVPEWLVGQEVYDQADSLMVSRAAYPHHPGNPQAQFFDDGAAQVGSHILWKYRPTCHEYADMLDDDSILDRAIKGTRLERTLPKNAAGQRSAIQQTMNRVAIPFRMMPRSDGRKTFTIRDWIKTRPGWIFLPNPQDTREAMVPLISMWADMLMLRAMKMGRRRDLPRIWFVYDELISLNMLPRLTTYATEGRKSGNPLLIGFQNMAQMDATYGALDARTIISQAGSAFLFGTRDPITAKYWSDYIGEWEFKRLHESWTHQRLGGWARSLNIETKREPRVPVSTIQNLPDLHGFLVQRKVVVPIAIPYLEPVIRNPDLLPAEPVATPAVPLPPPPEPEEKKGKKKAKAKVPCAKCNGSGHLPQFENVKGGLCFECKGKGEVDGPEQPSYLADLLAEEEVDA